MSSRGLLRVWEDSCCLHHANETLEEAKIGIENIDDCIDETYALEITSFENIPAHPAASSSSKTWSESSEFEEEGEDVGHEGEESHEQPSAPKDAGTGNAPSLEASQPSTSADKAD